MQLEARLASWVWAGALVLAAALLGIFALDYLDAVNHKSPAAALTPEQRPRTPVRAAPKDRPRRVTWVVLDGLRLDVSRQMPFLESLRARGFDAVATAPLPSLSRPSYTTLATGALPVRSGVRNNGFRGEAPLDSIFDRARAAGLETTGIANLSWWNDLFGRSFSSWHPVRGAAAENTSLIVTAAARVDLALVHLVDLDRVAHHQGVGDEYRARAREVDGVVAEIAGRLDLATDALIVTSDHGHRERGGHGGPEPEVVEVPLILAGKGVASGGPQAIGSTARLAPTLALLLGLELPRDASASPVLEALDPVVLGPLTVRSEEIAAHQAEYDRRLQSRLAPRSFLGAIAPRAAGLPWAPALALALGLLAWRRAPGGRRGLWALPLIGVAVLGALWVADLPISFSAIVTIPTLVVTLAIGTALGVAAYLVALERLLSGVAAEQRAAARRWNLRFCAVAYVALAPVCWSVFGYAHATALPGPAAMFLPLPAAFVGAGVAFVLSAALVLTAKRV